MHMNEKMGNFSTQKMLETSKWTVRAEKFSL